MHATQAKLSVYYRDIEQPLCQIDSIITTDPEGVTDEDITRLLQSAEEYVHPDVWPILVLIQGGKQ